MQSLNDIADNTVDCDVMIAGGGAAGAAAAISAAREGCSVLLAERTDRLGGIGTHGMLRSICGLYLNGGPETREPLNQGLAGEIAGKLSRVPGSSVRTMGKVRVLACAGGAFEQMLLSLCREQRELTCGFGWTVTAVSAEAGSVAEVILEREGTPKKARPRAVVDCTGSGEAATLAGAAYELVPHAERQLAGVTVRVQGLSRADASLQVRVPYILAKAADAGSLSPLMRFTTFQPGDTTKEGYLKFNVDPGSSGRDREVRAEIEQAVGILAGQLPFFTYAAVTGISPLLEREGRRILGEYTLTEEDVLSARKFPEGGVKNAWPIEFWDAERGTRYRYVPEGDYYEIPFRCQQVRGYRNLLTAGRCISASHLALASARVMGACIALGDRAGKAAARLARTGSYPPEYQPRA